MKLRYAASVTLLFATACQVADSPPGRAATLNEALLTEASPAERGHVTAARTNWDRAKDAHATAQADCQKKRDLEAGAHADRDSANAKVDRAEAEVTKSMEGRTSDEALVAKKALTVAKGDLALQDATLLVRSKQTEHASALADVAGEHVKVAEAGVDLAKVRAVNTLDRPLEQKPEIAKFEESVRRAEEGENVARAKATAAEREVAVANASLADCERANPR